MVESFFTYTRNIYCTEDSHSYELRKYFYSYESLKSVTGKVRYWPSGKQSIIVENETCEDLSNQCKIKFGDDFQYIQSGTSYTHEWDTVEACGIICPHLYADDHNYDHGYDI